MAKLQNASMTSSVWQSISREKMPSQKLKAQFHDWKKSVIWESWSLWSLSLIQALTLSCKICWGLLLTIWGNCKEEGRILLNKKAHLREWMKRRISISIITAAEIARRLKSKLSKITTHRWLLKSLSVPWMIWQLSSKMRKILNQSTGCTGIQLATHLKNHTKVKRSYKQQSKRPLSLLKKVIRKLKRVLEPLEFLMKLSQRVLKTITASSNIQWRPREKWNSFMKLLN